MSVTAVSRAGSIPRTTLPTTRPREERSAWPKTKGLAAATPRRPLPPARTRRPAPIPGAPRPPPGAPPPPGEPAPPGPHPRRARLDHHDVALGAQDAAAQLPLEARH